MKSSFRGFLCWVIGFHYIYYGKTGTQVLFWLAWFVGVAVPPAIILPVLWWLLDLLRLSGMTRRATLEFYREALGARTPLR